MLKCVSKANVQIYNGGRISIFAKMSDQTLDDMMSLGRGKVNTNIILGTEYKGENYRIVFKSK